MAWTDIPLTDTDAGSPITQTLVRALVDNPTGLADGDPGAPRIMPLAIGRTVTPGNVPIIAMRSEIGNVPVAVLQESIVLNVSGSFNYYIEIQNIAGSGSVAIRKNGDPTNLLVIFTGAAQDSDSGTISFDEGDVVELYGSSNTSAIATIFFTLSISTTDAGGRGILASPSHDTAYVAQENGVELLF